MEETSSTEPGAQSSGTPQQPPPAPAAASTQPAPGETPATQGETTPTSGPTTATAGLTTATAGLTTAEQPGASLPSTPTADSTNQPTGYGYQPPAYSTQPPGYGTQPPAYGTQPPAYGTQPPGYGYQPPAYGHQPPTGSGQAAPQPVPTQTWPPTTGRLTRSRSDRMIGGVCGGLARYWNTDPVLLRIVAVVITLFTGGLFALVYLLAWIVIPDEPAGPMGGYGSPGGSQEAGYSAQSGYSAGGAGYAGYAAMPASPPRQRSYLGWLVLSVAVLAAGVLGLVGLLTPAGVHMFALTGAVMLTILGIGLLVGTTRGRARWLVIPAIPVALLTFGAVTAGNFVEQHPDWERWTTSAGEPGRLSVGERMWAVSPADAQRGNLDYRLTAGSATLDLTGLSAPSDGGGRTVPIAAGVGLGELVVLVPDDVELKLAATVGAGQIIIPGQPTQDGQDLDVESDLPARTETPTYVVELDASIGIGELEVRHEAS